MPLFKRKAADASQPQKKRFQWLTGTVKKLWPFGKKKEQDVIKGVELRGGSIFDKAVALRKQVSEDQLKSYPSYKSWFEYFFKDKLPSTPDTISTKRALETEIGRIQNSAFATDNPMDLVVQGFQAEYLRQILDSPDRLTQVEKLRRLTKKRSETSRIARTIGKRKPNPETSKLVEKAKAVKTTVRFANDPELKDFIVEVEGELSDALATCEDTSTEGLRKVFLETVGAIIVRETARVSLDPSLGKPLIKKIRYLNHLKANVGGNND